MKVAEGPLAVDTAFEGDQAIGHIGTMASGQPRVITASGHLHYPLTGVFHYETLAGRGAPGSPGPSLLTRRCPKPGRRHLPMQHVDVPMPPTIGCTACHSRRRRGRIRSCVPLGPHRTQGPGGATNGKMTVEGQAAARARRSLSSARPTATSSRGPAQRAMWRLSTRSL